VKKTLLSWSSGKDSAWALHILRRQPDIDVTGLFCTVNQAFERVAMHAVRIELLQQQADNVGLPVQLVSIPNPCEGSEYDAIMAGFVERAKQQGIGCFAFGDLFLEDIRQYREARLAGTGIAPLFPLWGMPTRELSREMVNSGLRAKITCIDPKHLSRDFAGQEYDLPFLQRLPANVDPCGENGEFHSFAFDGPMFSNAVSVATGETVARDGFIFTDLLPDNSPQPPGV
jgi:uncharacterized protein (TIGR00290 family)